MSKKQPRTTPSHRQPSSPMDPRLLEQIVKLMVSNDLNTVDVRDGDRRAILKRGPAVAPITYATAPQPVMTSPNPAPMPVVAGTPAPTPVKEDADAVPIVSPMVGTFYSKASPDAKPFVTIGSRVDEETVVCVVEAMKHFNPVKAETRGTITRILVSDGEVVDVNKPMFLVKPS